MISCVSKKLQKKITAEKIYISSLFKKNLKYAKSLNPDLILILSAKHGVLELNQEIEPYDKTLNKMNKKESEEWAEKVLNQLKNISDLKKDNFIFLAGNNYRKNILSEITNYEVPMKGLKIGKQLQWLTENTMENNCSKLHKIFNDCKHHSIPYNENEIPKNGIYILFEKGEFAHGGKRIVRIGTHTGADQLRSRIKQHFLSKNKDRSIFRKNIGRAILNSKNDCFIEQWEWDLTTRANKEKYSDLLDKEKQEMIENQVTEYMQSNFSFAVFEINEKDDRMLFESRIISTVSNCHECGGNENWLGNHSPKEKIRKSGLWLINELWKKSITDEELIKLTELVKSTTYNNV